MATRFKPRPGPPLRRLGLRAHHWVRGQWGRCQSCQMPRNNRVHHADEIARQSAEWAQHDAARLGEPEPETG